MKKTSLKLKDVLQLNYEVGVLLTENIPFKVKYWLNKLFDLTSKEAENFDKIRKELIDKYGTAKDGKPKSIAEGDKNWKKYEDELTPVADTEIVLEHAVFQIADMEFNSKNHYYMFLKLVSEPEPNEV